MRYKFCRNDGKEEARMNKSPRHNVAKSYIMTAHEYFGFLGSRLAKQRYLFIQTYYANISANLCDFIIHMFAQAYAI